VVGIVGFGLSGCVADPPPLIGVATGGDQAARVSWQPPLAAPIPITAYVVTPWVGQVAQSSIRFNSTATTQTLTGLTNGTTYTFTVKAVDALGNDSASSASSNPVTPAVGPLSDLAGGVYGPQSYMPAGQCNVFQTFDSSYPGGGAVGTVTLHMVGCVQVTTLSYAGTFSMLTTIGTVSGTAAGPLHLSCFPSDCPFNYDLTLVVTSGTGGYADVVGTLHAFLNWGPGSDDPDIDGTITVP
jgi:hypothetical protein